MRALIKPLFISTAISTLSLCFTISHAATIIPAQENDNSQFVVMTKLFPQSEQIVTKPVSYIQVFDKPLVRIPLTTHEEPLEQYQAPRKKNHFFEIATVFNDKLHQFIADISHSDSDDISTKSSPMHANSKHNCKSKN